ncbi:MAG: hypothetical protein EOO04_20965 [Chitinophagaceae bacterium]|nr:MAG: hypothetical protein EOO04_20965 [Chitinophagaceae bacterium]
MELRWAYVRNGLCLLNMEHHIRWMLFLPMFFTLVCSNAAELHWDGEGNDGLWQNAINWSTNTMPAIGDEVVFDNLYQSGSYSVTIATGSGLISPGSIRITPSGANSITLIIPASNTEAPALRCSGAIYGLVLDRGAIFVNESGAAAGATVEISDSIRINNGGRYIHRTPRSHAETIRSLSRAPGTEVGEFEFGIPVASSTISLSGQVFGRLRLGAGPNGSINYTGTGTNGLTIRSDLEILPGVNLTLNLEGTMLIRQNLIHDGGVLNLGSTARKLVVEVGGNILQSATSIITESGMARPEITLSGNSIQELNIRGNITNEVGLNVNNAAGVILRSDLSLPYKLKLENGCIKTDEHLLSLQTQALLEVSAVNSASFVNGRLEKKGLVNATFMFPVGSGETRRWLQLHSATGDFTAEYIRADPRLLSSDYGIGIAHVSSIEYWKITGSGPAPGAIVELSFDNVNSGGITDLDNLRVAWLNSTNWQSAGNTGTTGSAGSAGSVSSTMQVWASGQAVQYSLASNAANQNPLPIVWKNFRAIANGEVVKLEWMAESETGLYYQLEKSFDGVLFSYVNNVHSKYGVSNYYYTDRVETIDRGLNPTQLFYRISMIKPDSSRSLSKIVRVQFDNDIIITPRNLQYNPTTFLSSGLLKMNFPDLRNIQYVLTIVDISGRVLYKGMISVINGKVYTRISLGVLSNMPVFIQLRDRIGNKFTQKIMVTGI